MIIAQKKRNILGENIPHQSLFILIGKKEQIRNGDVIHSFRQDSDILLLTEVSSPDIVLVGIKKKENIEWILYSDPISESEKIWGTSRQNYDEIREASWIENIRSIDSLKKDLQEWTIESERIYLKWDSHKNIGKWIIIPKERMLSLDPLLKSLRMIKIPEEVEYIREAIRVTKIAHDLVRDSIRPGMYEYEIEAIIASVFRSHHLTEAYPTIVASGPNACTLHYIRHDRKIEAWDIVLIDAWAEYRGYAADITRSYNVWVISLRQKEVYEGVPTVKKYAESLIRPGMKKLDYEKRVREKMNEELIKLELIPKWASPEIVEKLSRKYYPHSVSHFLGLDVHDTWERDEVFHCGMIITCEPGIYIPEEGIGIRLEDDILITENGHENLSRNISL